MQKYLKILEIVCLVLAWLFIGYVATLLLDVGFIKGSVTCLSN